jgi:hypothetical protein
MFVAAGDPEIWAGHPAKDRYKREVFEPYFASLLSTKTALTVIDIHSGEIVGTSSYYTPPDLPNSIAIGFTFLIRAKLKLGAVHLYDAVLNVSTAPQEGKCYGLTKTQWAQSLMGVNAQPSP